MPVKKMPKRYQPKGFEILYEDKDIIVGNKAIGFLTVSALWNKENTIHSALDKYVRKGNSKSKKCVYVVHRLDQDTSGVLIFAKTEAAQIFLKDHWQRSTKMYYAIVHGRMEQKSGTISSYLIEDEDYRMHVVSDGASGKLSHTAYSVLKEDKQFSLVKIDLLTGRKNQIRVHFADQGHPVVGDTKYGKTNSKHKFLALHAYSLSFTHPFSKQQMTFTAKVPEHFSQLIEYAYSEKVDAQRKPS